jgi:transcriptional regulator with XRE-family HTH domain
VTVAALVGRNVRLARERRGWDRERLAEEGALLDIEWTAATIASIEEGTGDITISDLVSLAVILGIAPHLLMYPKPGVVIGLGPRPPESPTVAARGEEVLVFAETHLAAAELAGWIWEPDGHPYTQVEVSERDLWLAADPGGEG